LEASGRADLAEMIARLKSPSAPVRRVAAMDLLQQGSEEALCALLEHLLGEADEKCAVLIVRGLGKAEYIPARGALARLRDNPATPIRVYHAAILANDRLERAERGPIA
jgi:hypothetical protein